MNDRNRDLLGEAMGADVVPAPPPGLAGRVAEAVVETARTRSAPGEARAAATRRLLPLLATLAAGAVLGALVVRLYPRAAEVVVAGERTAAERETIRLGTRAVLVAEEGAELRWRQDGDGGVLVDQTSGDVFYRVNTGPFAVHTPFGVVSVRGTSFRVEVINVKLDRQNLKVAALGAALGVAVVVTVYEGRVLLAGDRATIELSPGERGQASPGGDPRRLAPIRQAALDSAQPGAAARVPVFDETASLRARIAEQEKELAQLRPAGQRPKKAEPGKESYLTPTREQLLARAERCEIRYDTPSIRGVDEQDRVQMGLSETERDAMNEALEQLKAHAMGEMRRLYVEMSGDPATADKLSPGTMESEIYAKAPEGAKQRARQQLARERAGLSPPPADLGQTPVVERTLRLMMSLGDEFEKRLGERIGPERARALRARNDGWRQKTVTNGCE